MYFPDTISNRRIISAIVTVAVCFSAITKRGPLPVHGHGDVNATAVTSQDFFGCEGEPYAKPCDVGGIFMGHCGVVSVGRMRRLCKSTNIKRSHCATRIMPSAFDAANPQLLTADANVVFVLDSATSSSDCKLSCMCMVVCVCLRVCLSPATF